MDGKLPRCPKGTRRNPRTKLCEAAITQPVVSKYSPVFVNPDPLLVVTRCPKGTRRNPRTKRCEATKPKLVVNSELPPPSPPVVVVPTLDSKISFLFLTYGNIVHEEAVYNVVRNHNVLIHPKYPDQVSDRFRPHITQTLVPTSWGQWSIVNATIYMLHQAYQADPSSQWFVLLSGDVYPMMSEAEMCAFLATQTKSIFHQKEDPKDGVWKSSQWWILNRADALKVITKHNQYRPRPGVFVAAFDEIYFLSLLQSTIPDYSFTNMPPVYCRWLTHTIQKSPATFNGLTDADLRHIRRAGSLFLRKTSPLFLPVPKIAEKTLVVVYVGTESNTDYARLLELPDIDVAVLSAVPLEKIPGELADRALYIHSIIWKFAAESIANMTVGHFSMWDRIVFLSESFVSSELAGLRFKDAKRVPMVKSGKGDLDFVSPLHFQPLYVNVADSRGHLAHVFTNTKGSIAKGQPVIR